MFSPTRPITIDAASRRRQPSYPDYDYGIHAEAVPPVDSGDMMFDLDGTYDYALANPHAWPAHTAPAAFDLSSPVADYMSPTKDNTFFDPSSLLGHDLSGAMDDDYSWALATGVSTSAPIAIPEPKFAPSQQQQPSFMSYNDFSSPLFQDAHAFSPGFSPSSFSPESDFAALHSPTSPPAFTFHNELPQQYGTPIEALSALTISPQETTLPYGTSAPAPAWAAHLWPAQHEQPQVDAYQPRSYVPEDIMPRRARALSQSLLFHPSTSAPSAATIRPPALARGYSTQSDSVGADASTVRRRSRSHSTSSEAFAEPGTPEARATSPLKDASITADKAAESGSSKSALRPPKLAPSAWQLYFTDWIQKHQQTSTKKLNVAQAAKEAGAEYAALTTEEKEPYKRKSQQAKDAREREHNAYMRTLTPDDIKRENVFRTAQRKAGKSRRGNLKDPNAPKKPLSAYFMFLQRIRSDAELVVEVFGEETETTKQSVLAASKWRSMTDDERKPFLAEAERMKLEYEEKRKIYEQGHAGYAGSFNFSILSGSSLASAPIPRGKRVVKADADASA